MCVVWNVKAHHHNLFALTITYLLCSPTMQIKDIFIALFYCALPSPLLNHGIQQPSYHQGKKLSNKNMKVKHVFYVPTVMLQLLSYNNYCHAHIVIGKLERRPPITCKPPIVVAYRLQHM
jgi:hypothetical protein